jgi:hypothetical protein
VDGVLGTLLYSLECSAAHNTPTMASHQNGGSSTCVVEQPIELQDASSYLSKPQDAKVAASKTSLRLSDQASRDDDPVENLPSPTTQAAEKLERWNSPRTNLYRSGAAFWSFVVMGSNDAAYGALIPYVSSRPLALAMLTDQPSSKNTTTSLL